MSKQVLDDARAAYAAWKDTQQGSYVERVLADAIVREILPALIHVASRGPVPTGFHGVEVEAAEEISVTDDVSMNKVSHIGA